MAKAGRATELVSERGFILVKSPGESVQRAFLSRAPRNLETGKTAWIHLTSYLSFFPFLRRLSDSLVITHVSYDRALYMPMVKKINAVQKLYYQRLPERVKQEGKADLLELTDWLVSTPCCNHDAQNALCWATTVATGNEDSCLKSLYSVLAALKQGYSLLLDHLPSFLQKRLRYRDLSFDRQTNYIFWDGIGCPLQHRGRASRSKSARQ